MTDRILLVTGLAGAGKTTALKTFEDLGWEVVDNLPIRLLDRLLAMPAAGEADRPLAFGIDSRTRDFEPVRILRQIESLRRTGERVVELLFLDCGAAELERRFSETRRRHPLALERPVTDGILREHELLDPLRDAADMVIDTTGTTTNRLQQTLRDRFGGAGDGLTLSIQSFGFARGVPRNADLVFDMRFLRNPHWDPDLRPLTGLDSGVGDFVRADPAYEAAFDRIGGLIELLLPRYHAEGKSYVTVAFGCTGGRHRSVHFAEAMAKRLRDSGFSPTILHRDLPPE
ncbi:RNase adapter RapZ [Sphingomonas sp. ID0503]|uniref:RNase adapter RapZ n=1 Tax=Sphingomonas sp. ID0503 TaxID=3399691 RepID=UPI003AFA9DDD